MSAFSKACLAYVTLTAMAACNSPPPAPTAHPAKQTWTPHERPTPGFDPESGARLPASGDRCSEFKLPEYCVEPGTLMRCIDGRFVKHYCEVCSQTLGSGGAVSTHIIGGCERAGLAAPGASCNATSKDCDGSVAMVVCDGEHFVHYPCRGPLGCSLDAGVHCDTAAARREDPCAIDNDHACSEDGGAKLLCLFGKWQELRKCDGAGGCKVTDTLLTCAVTGKDVGEACGEPVVCSRDGKARLYCDDGVYAVARQCPSGCRDTGEVDVKCE